MGVGYPGARSENVLKCSENVRNSFIIGDDRTPQKRFVDPPKPRNVFDSMQTSDDHV